MADFDKAIDVILDNEKGFSDRKSDRGGPTNFGISLKFLRSLGKDGDLNLDGVIDINDIKYLDEDKAEDLYQKYFWDENGYDKIQDQRIATKLFDIAVNCGPATATRVIQNSINVISAEDKLKVDGILGSKTIKAINSINPSILLKQMIFFQKNYYLSVLERFPDQKENINGWINRANKI
jgi:lysozyme family protein